MKKQAQAGQGRADRIVSMCLIVPAVLLTFVDLITGQHSLATYALALTLGFIAIGWKDLKSNARFMLAMAGAVLVACVIVGLPEGTFAVIASRAMYLPALIAVMTLLRVAAQQSPMVTGAGHYVVEQPPNRRFLLLASGSHIFGVLLNLGGFMLLLNIAMRTVAATAPDARIEAIQTRRVANAIGRGFAATLFWSPLGVAINLMLPIFPDLTWFKFLPYGIAGLSCFMLISWLFDQFEPRARSARPKTSGRGHLWQLLGLVATLVFIAGAAGLIEVSTGLPLRAAILMIVPAYAFTWAAFSARNGAIAPALWQTGAETAHQLPRSKSEICVMTASGFVGLALAALVPTSFVEEIIAAANLSNGLLASAVALLILGLSMVGISPVITGTLFVAAIAQTDVTIPDAMLMLAALAGWSCAVLLSPMTTTVAIVSGLLDKPASLVGLRWNGPTAAAILGVSIAGFLLFY